MTSPVRVRFMAQPLKDRSDVIYQSASKLASTGNRGLVVSKTGWVQFRIEEPGKQRFVSQIYLPKASKGKGTARVAPGMMIYGTP